MQRSLTGKHAFVCGSTQGIGKATAMELAQLGARLTLIARDAQALAQITDQLDRSQGQEHDYLVADFEQPEVLKATVQAYLDQDHVIHVLINNTGGPPGGSILDATPEAFLRAYHMHLVCNQVLAQAVVPGMKAAGYGRLIQIISTSVREPIPGLGVSNTTRGAVASWAKTLSRELAPHGITVNNVLPGFTETERLYSIIRARAKESGQTEEQVIEHMKASVPAGRFAQASEVAQAIAFLASPQAAYINGVSLAVDGGRTHCI